MDFRFNSNRLIYDAIRYELNAIREFIEWMYEFRYLEEDIEKHYEEIRKSPLFQRDIDSIYTHFTNALENNKYKPAWMIDDCILICIVCAIKIPQYQSDADFHLCWRLIVLANRCTGVAMQAMKYEQEEKDHRDNVINSNEDNIQVLRRTDPLLYEIVEILRWKCPNKGWKRLSIALKENESAVLAALEKYKPSTNEKMRTSGSLLKDDPLKYLSTRINSRRNTDPAFKAITNSLLEITNKKKQPPAKEPSLDITRLESIWNFKSSN